MTDAQQRYAAQNMQAIQADPMHNRLPSLRFVGATTLCDTGLTDAPLAVSGGRIGYGIYPSIDLTGYLILPGIIDLHGDAFERHIAPRPNAPFPLASGLQGVDRDAAANGVTTAWLAQSWSWEGGARGAAFAQSVAAALADYRPHALTDLRLQIRYETHDHDTTDQLLDTVARYGIGYVVFNNHLDEALDMWRDRPHEVWQWAKRAGRTGPELMAVVQAAKARTGEVPRRLCKLADAFDSLGVIYGSHDDPDGETRETYAMLGARICEFPTSVQAAAVAKAVGDPVLMGAPNVVRGGSQAGNISAAKLVRDGKCDILVSDYHYPSLAMAAFRLVDDGIRPLPQAWAMISTAPAELMRLHDRGVIAQGRRADLCIINSATRTVEATIAGGRITHLAGEAAHRFLSSAQSLGIAAA